MLWDSYINRFTEYLTSKLCNQINLSSLHLVTFIIREIDPEQDAENRTLSWIYTVYSNVLY
jgi:hypothetical protein